MAHFHYLHQAWIEAAAEAVSGMSPIPQGLTVGYRTMSSPASSYSIQFGPDLVMVRQGSENCDVTFVTSGPLAAEIARGERSAQRAFLDGLIRVEGDVNVLLGHGPKLEAVQDLLSELRADTIFDYLD